MKQFTAVLLEGNRIEYFKQINFKQVNLIVDICPIL